MNMKKIIGILLISVMLIVGLFVLTGCNNKKEDKLDYANMTADDLLAKIKDKDNVTPDEMKWLVSTYSYVKIDEEKLDLEDNITDEAIKKLDSKALPKLDSYIGELFKSDAPQVRGYAVSNITSLFGVSNENLVLAKELIKNEKEPYVLKKAVVALRNEGKNDKDIADFLLNMANNQNAVIRKEAAIALANSWSKGIDGAVDTVIKLMNDSDIEVRKVACKYAGELEDEKVIDPLVKILNNNDEADLHGSCIEGLVDLWYDYPFFKSTSEKAYKATMDYLKKTPRTDKVPAWTAVGAFKTTSTQDAFKEWKKKATYFNTDEVYNVMVDIIKDGDANWLGRTSAIDVIKNHCSEQQFKDLKSVIDGLTDKNASLVQSSYEKK